jgi:hypothetical protein
MRILLAGIVVSRFQGRVFFPIVIAGALFSAVSGAGAATPVEPFGDGKTVQATPAPNANPVSGAQVSDAPAYDSWSYKSLLATDAEELARWVGLAPTPAGADAGAVERSRWIKVVLALAGLAFLFRRRAWWRKAAYLHSNVHNPHGFHRSH